MPEVNLLQSIPRSTRNINLRQVNKSAEKILKALEFGQLYFDGPREYGYGGYYYDGRWKTVAEAIIIHFNLKPGDKFLDIGCAKGFLVKDLISLGIDAYGLDISEYAMLNCEPEVIGRLHLGNAISLPFPDKSFKACSAINIIHNLTRENCVIALKEIERVAPGNGFIQVDSYYTKEQKEIFENWALTARFYGYPEEWFAVFKEANYTGDWFWTIIQ